MSILGVLGHRVDMNALFMIHQPRSRTLAWNLLICSLEGPIEPSTETIVEDMHAHYFRWGKSTESMRRDIDEHADRIAHSGVWEEPTTLVDTHVFGQFATLLSTSLANRAICIPPSMIGEILETESQLRASMVKVT